MRSKDFSALSVEQKKPPLFFANYQIDGKNKIVINQGGTYSGKTYAILDVLFIRAIKKENTVITVVGQDLPNLRRGAFRDACSIWAENHIYKKTFKMTENVMQFKALNGSRIEFTSFGSPQDAKGAKRDYLFLNEADALPRDTVDQLMMRTNNVTYIDYNPNTRFWAHDLMANENVTTIYSDHRHNPYLSEEKHNEIESISDENFFNVYARGKTGRVKGLIYDNWELSGFYPPAPKQKWYGIDFGFTAPTAIVEVALYDGKLYVKELCYEPNLVASEVLNKVRTLCDLRCPIVADSASPSMIEELQRGGIRVIGAKKGADSINTGISLLQGYKICVESNSKNLKFEFENYRRKKDSGGYDLNEPVKKHDHILDAIRYVALEFLGTRKQIAKPRILTRSLPL